MRVVYDEELNADLIKIFKEAKEYITIICPYIKLNERIRDVLKQKSKSDPNLKLTVVYGKNEGSANKEDLIFFSKNFNDVCIFYKERLHAKCYVNEKMGLITSMNLYEYSIQNNLELGVFYENSNIVSFDSLNEILTGSKSIDGQIPQYLKHVIETSDIIFKKKALYKDTMLGLAKEYNNSKIIIDNIEKQLTKIKGKKEKVVVENKTESNAAKIIKPKLPNKIIKTKKSSSSKSSKIRLKK